VRNEQNRSVCNIGGVNADMSANDAAGFVAGIQEMYNRGKVTARIHSISAIEIND
jgi:hypothetical protein